MTKFTFQNNSNQDEIDSFLIHSDDCITMYIT